MIANGERKKSLYFYLRNPKVNFLSTAEIEILDRAREARNQAVHEKLPIPKQMSTSSHASEGERDGPATTLTAEAVREVLEVIFKAFREINRRGIPAYQ
jgi:hypothetical protein